MIVTCEECGNKFKVKDNYFEHQPRNYDEQFTCDNCELKQEVKNDNTN